MKRLIVALILAVVLTVTLAAPAFAGPPPDAGKGTVGNEALANVWRNLVSSGFHGYNWWAEEVIYWLWRSGPPAYFAPAN